MNKLNCIPDIKIKTQNKDRKTKRDRKIPKQLYILYISYIYVCVCVFNRPGQDNRSVISTGGQQHALNIRSQVDTVDSRLIITNIMYTKCRIYNIVCICGCFVIRIYTDQTLHWALKLLQTEKINLYFTLKL